MLGFVGDFVENGGSNLLLSSGRQDLCDFLVHPHIPFVFLFFFAIFRVFSCDFRFTCFYSTVFSKFFMDLLVLVVLILWLEFRFESL